MKRVKRHDYRIRTIPPLPYGQSISMVPKWVFFDHSLKVTVKGMETVHVICAPLLTSTSA